ncbi:HAD family hydrolase [Flammeovirga aprica]|uniref:phosphoserine phosphatase n=1 Tax=Flammeovirga aprica JL-4 TaxID=694437 RepID=A0A7X9RVR7_9BACT|nr:HAD-IB family phosphatase [Flammeovirga aprica]NME69618.1 HAD-IB family phosphatase [Flammeovirga aprica JL-4]
MKEEKHLAVFDIDGTIREIVDPWMMLHHYFNTSKEGGVIYKNWVEGVISYHEMCEQDALLWKGKSKEEMLVPLQKNSIRSGSAALISYLKENNFRCIGISTGLSLFNDITSEIVGLEKCFSNEILFEEGICNGEVKVKIEEFQKHKVLKQFIEENNITGKVISFGDGKSDIDLFKNSDLSFAVHFKYDEVKEAATYQFEGNDFMEMQDLIKQYL